MHVDSQEVSNLVALAMRQSMTASELREQIFIHPSSTEALNDVLGSWNNTERIYAAGGYPGWIAASGVDLARQRVSECSSVRGCATEPE